MVFKKLIISLSTLYTHGHLSLTIEDGKLSFTQATFHTLKWED